MGLSITNKLDSLTSSNMFGDGRNGGEREPTYLDMMLVLDSSGSIGSSEFREAKHATTVKNFFVMINKTARVYTQYKKKHKIFICIFTCKTNID